MIPEKVTAALTEHLGAEVSSAYTYLAMSAHLDVIAFKGFARWMRVQFQEEMDHATRMLDYLLRHGCPVSFPPIAAPPARYGSVLEVFERTLENERQVTQRVHGLHQ